MSGPKPIPICESCKHLSANKKFCRSTEATRWRKGQCVAYERGAGHQAAKAQTSA